MNELTITTGTYFGECMGICADILTITSEKMHFENYAVAGKYDRPLHVDDRETKPEEWEAITRNIDLAAFRKLPDQIGRPDADDGGGEFVQIAAGPFIKRVDFPYGSSLPEIDDLLEILRGIRREFVEANR